MEICEKICQIDAQCMAYKNSDDDDDDVNFLLLSSLFVISPNLMATIISAL